LKQAAWPWWAERDAGLLAARRCRDAHAEQEAACRSVSARRCRCLNIVVPFGEPITIGCVLRCDPAAQACGEMRIDLDGFFGLHPSLAPLEPLFHKNQLAIVHAAGSPDPTRSHFDAQDFMESARPA